MTDAQAEYSFGALEKMQLATGLNAQQYTKLLIGYIINNDLINAKFTWNTVPESVKLEEPFIREVWCIAKGLINYAHAESFRVIKNTPWPEWVKPLIDILHNALVERCMTLVAKAYTAISILKFSEIFGMSKEEAIVLCQKYKWSVDVVSGFIEPHQLENIAIEEESLSCRIPKLTDYISFLEC